MGLAGLDVVYRDAVGLGAPGSLLEEAEDFCGSREAVLLAPSADKVPEVMDVGGPDVGSEVDDLGHLGAVLLHHAHGKGEGDSLVSKPTEL